MFTKYCRMLLSHWPLEVREKQKTENVNIETICLIILAFDFTLGILHTEKQPQQGKKTHFTLLGSTFA